jgi:hypothetical protein
LGSALEQYRGRFEGEGQEPDEMITSAGDYLINVLAPADRRLRLRRALLLATSAACLVAAGYLAWQDWRDWRAARAAAGSGGGAGAGGARGGGGAGSGGYGGGGSGSSSGSSSSGSSGSGSGTSGGDKGVERALAPAASSVR